MLARPVNPLHRRVLVLVTLVCFFAACHKWVPIESPVEQALAEHSGKVRITNREGAVAELEATWIARDSVFGLTKRDTMAWRWPRSSRLSKKRPTYQPPSGSSSVVWPSVSVSRCLFA